MTRRTVLASGAAAAATALTPAFAQRAGIATAPATGEPPVFLSYSQTELDALYAQDRWAPNVAQVRARWAANSAAARARLGAPRRVAYGPSPVEQLDIYRTARLNAPIQIFVHGGAWQRGSAADSAFAAELVTNAGAHFVVPDFAHVQDVDGSLLELARQIRRAVTWTFRHASTFGGDPHRLYISGHSSGAHLAAVALTSDWAADGLPPELLKGGLCCSGIFDLRGPRLSSRREYVRFDDATEQTLSPLRHLSALQAPMAIAYGSLDNVEFQRQSRAFAEALDRRAHPVQCVVGDHYNHFELIETMANPYGVVGRLMLAQMGLAPPQGH